MRLVKNNCGEFFESWFAAIAGFLIIFIVSLFGFLYYLATTIFDKLAWSGCADDRYK